MILSAKDLVIKYLELLSFTPNLDEWDEQYLSNNPPRYYRFRQLKILFDAYSLDNITDFEKGEFILTRPLEVYKKLVNMAKHFHKEIQEWEFDYYNEEEHLEYRMIMMMFTKLIGYRKVISKAIHYNDGDIEYSGFFRYAVELIGHFNHTISKELDSIDDVLSFIISPSGETFSVNELISKYGFPDVNLKDIDIEWI